MNSSGIRPLLIRTAFEQMFSMNWNPCATGPEMLESTCTFRPGPHFFILSIYLTSTKSRRFFIYFAARAVPSEILFPSPPGARFLN